jgi:hypothetical protein
MANSFLRGERLRSRDIRPVKEATTKFEVVGVENGRMAPEYLFSRGGPRLALWDWLRPGLNGLEVCREIRRHSVHGRAKQQRKSGDRKNHFEPRKKPAHEGRSGRRGDLRTDDTAEIAWLLICPGLLFSRPQDPEAVARTLVTLGASCYSLPKESMVQLVAHGR